MTLIAGALAMPFLLGSSCPTYEPPPPPTLGGPALNAPELREAVLGGVWREAVWLRWSPPSTDLLNVKFYRILRRTHADSGFEVVSPLIPDTILEFPDAIDSFPQYGSDSLIYAIFAVDSLGRPGDTSAPVHVVLTAQPALDTVIVLSACVKWSISRIRGSVLTWARVWNESGSTVWNSDTVEDFIGEDAVWPFGACMPAELRPLTKGRWWIAVHVDANGFEHSITVEHADVP